MPVDPSSVEVRMKRNREDVYATGDYYKDFFDWSLSEDSQSLTAAINHVYRHAWNTSPISVMLEADTPAGTRLTACMELYIEAAAYADTAITVTDTPQPSMMLSNDLSVLLHLDKPFLSVDNRAAIAEYVEVLYPEGE